MNNNPVNQEMYLEIKKKWKSLYPIYFDAQKTLKQGRRLAAQHCVKRPTLEEVVKAVCMCQLRNIVEPQKMYSRDYFEAGRVKVELMLENGNPVHVGIPNKKKLLLKVGTCLRQMRSK